MGDGSRGGRYTEVGACEWHVRRRTMVRKLERTRVLIAWCASVKRARCSPSEVVKAEASGGVRSIIGRGLG